MVALKQPRLRVRLAADSQPVPRICTQDGQPVVHSSQQTDIATLKPALSRSRLCKWYSP
jgi:hypothetical protein